MTTACQVVLATATLVACGGDVALPTSIEGGALAVGGDYAGSGVATHIDVSNLQVRENVVAGVVGGDPAIRRLGDRLFVLDRFGGDSVTVLNAELQLVAQASTGAGSNPQDVAAVGDRAFVAALDVPGILVLDLLAPERGVVETIDLSSLDEDGVPDCGSVVAHRGLIYASCSLFDRSEFPWSPRRAGAIVAIDPDAGTWRVLQTERQNPFGWMQVAGETLYISSVPDPFSNLESGCLETVDLRDFSPSGCLVEYAELGGYAASMAVADETLWAAIATSATTGTLMRYDGTWSPFALGESANPTDVVRCTDGALLVADNSAASRGVRVLDGDIERTARPLPVGWPTVFTPANALACW